MSKKESGGHETLWLWDGEDEYEGPLGVSGEHHLVARVRLVRRWTLASGAPGRPVPVDLLERQRALSRRICFAQSPAVLFGSLLEFRVAAVQPCRDRRFDFVLSGSFVPEPAEHPGWPALPPGPGPLGRGCGGTLSPGFLASRPQL